MILLDFLILEAQNPGSQIVASQEATSTLKKAKIKEYTFTPLLASID